jgi:RNA polymerase sigma-70 factor (ECF subfamily)
MSGHRLRRQLPEKRDQLYRVAFSWCHDPALADDLVQETLAKALTKGHQLRDRERLEPWLFRVLSNCWKDYLRARREMQDIDDVVLASPDTPADNYGEQQLVDRVRVGVAQLPLGQRQVLTLVDLEGFSYAEVAEVLQIPIGTVMSRLNRARTALADRLRTYRAALADPPPVTNLRRIK